MLTKNFGKTVFLVAVLIAFTGCDNTDTNDTSVPIGKSLIVYSSCDDLTAALADIPVVDQSYSGGDVALEGGGTAEPAAENEDDDQVVEETNAATEVEEADIVKADDRYVYLLQQSGKLIIYDALDSESIQKAGEVELNTNPGEMVVEGDVAAIIGSPSVDSDLEYDDYYSTIISLVDISDRTNPTVVREIRIDGSYIDSRLVGAYMHIVASYTNYYQTTEHPESGDIAQKIVDSSFATEDRVDTEITTACTNIYMPTTMRFDAYGGYYTTYITQIATINLADIDADVASNVALTAYPTVAASPHRLLLADWDWEYDSTALHVFDIESDPSKPTYVGAATFTGKVLNQFSMDESEGTIRVAITTNTNTGGSADNDNGVIVFQEESGALTEVGHLSGVAVGESIWSARFLGDKAFLVTYETIDPLITIDLTDPANPTVAGELEVPGVSTYLHVVDENHLLSVGLDFGEDGTTWGGGVALSLFDVTDFANPSLAYREVIETGGGGAYSEANSTHKAFAYFSDSGIVAIPVTTYPVYYEEGVSYTSKLYVYHVDPSEGFTELAVIDHSDLIPEEDMPEWGLYGYAMRRALMIGDAFFSISDYAVKAHDKTNFATPLFSDYTGLSSFDYGEPMPMAE